MIAEAEKEKMDKSAGGHHHACSRESHSHLGIKVFM